MDVSKVVRKLEKALMKAADIKATKIANQSKLLGDVAEVIRIIEECRAELDTNPDDASRNASNKLDFALNGGAGWKGLLDFKDSLGVRQLSPSEYPGLDTKVIEHIVIAIRILTAPMAL